LKSNRILIITLAMLWALIIILPRTAHGAVAVPQPRARRYMDDPEKLPKAPPPLSEEEKKLLEEFGPKDRPDQAPRFRPPTPTARPVPMSSPEPSPTPEPAPIERPSNTCFIVIIIFLILIITGILTAPSLIKKIVEHRRHNF